MATWKAGETLLDEDVTPSCDKNLRYIVWKRWMPGRDPSSEQTALAGEPRPDLHRNSDDRGKVEESTEEMICTQGLKT